MDKVEKMAYQFRITHGISDFPITYERLLEIMKERGYKVRYYAESEEELKENDLWKHTSSPSFSGIVNGVISTYIDDNVKYEDRLLIIVHELAHIVMGDIFDRASEHTQEHENRATEFAAYFLAPPCYVDKLGIKTLKELEKLLPYEHRLCKEIWANLTAWQRQHNAMTYEEQAICKIMDSKKRPETKIKIPKTLTTTLGICACIICFLTGQAINTPANNTNHVGNFNYSYAETENIIVPDKEETVYVTATGKKYHLSGCRYIKGKTNLTQLDLNEAEEEGYTACSVCF